MGLSVIQEVHDTIIDTIKNITNGDWKVLVVDEASKKILDNAVKEDDILNHNIANIERIEERREMNPTMDAVYFLSPLPHIVECVAADLERGRYRRSFLLWTGPPPNGARRRLEGGPGGRQQIGAFDILNLDFSPRESHLVTFRDPWSFPILYNPSCDGLVPDHLQTMASKICGVCVALGEYPKVRYYRPRQPTNDELRDQKRIPLHEASVLCMHLARMVQSSLDEYAHYNPNFPPQTARPQGVLLITDRSMDLMAPLIHEFSYQAVAHDLLPIKDGDKVTFNMTIKQGMPDEEKIDMELSDKDKIWVETRHMHLGRAIDALKAGLRKFMDDNRKYENDDSENAPRINDIKDMIAGLSQFTEGKEAYTLHQSFAKECMDFVLAHKLIEVGMIEQILATGVDDRDEKNKSILNDVAQWLDDPDVEPSDRFRLLVMWLVNRRGTIPDDIKKLLEHAQLPTQRGEIIANLSLLGAHIERQLKEPRSDPVPPLFPVPVTAPKNSIGGLFASDPRAAPQARKEKEDPDDELVNTRFKPAVKHMLDALFTGTLNPDLFPHTKPPLDPNEDAMIASQTSLRSQPRWASAGRRAPDNRMRVMVFVAGGATYSESRACYKASEQHGRDVVLITSHMLTPNLFLRQLGDLSADRRRLDLPVDRPKPKPPAHLFERERPTPPPMGAGPGAGRPGPPGMGQPIGGGPRGGRPPPAGGIGGIPSSSRPGGPPTQQMGQMSLGGGGQPLQPGPNGRTPPSTSGSGDGKLPKDKEKKKRNIFGLKK